ncbi:MULTISPECIES: hypothetical protein [Streptomyces]|uniref:GAF domain-containing protein n=1 Tax=Streptomyces mangrovi TaxID=1206892 RepID=A0ABV9IY66_9ACTN
MVRHGEEVHRLCPRVDAAARQAGFLCLPKKAGHGVLGVVGVIDEGLGGE